jgi:hypothetical protein
VNARRGPALPPYPSDGLLGTTGSLSGHELLGAVRAWLPSGTLALAQGQDVAGVRVLRGVALMAIAAGDVTARHMLGRFAGLAAADLDVHAVSHAPSNLPRLPSVAPDCDLECAQALPRFVSSMRLLPAVSDVKPLLAKLGEAGWHGALLGRSTLGSALALLLDGRVVAARGRRGGGALERQDAVRLLQRLALDSEPNALHLVPLEPRSAAAIAGFALGHVHEVGDSPHTGIEVGPAGITFYYRGEPYLALAGAGLLSSGTLLAPASSTAATAATAAAAGALDVPVRRFDALDEPAAPTVPLPDEPPGWEARHYVLTLRGRDALNPMTELWMRFRASHGALGQQLLEVLVDGASLESAAGALGTPLEELRPLVQKLEAEGLVRMGAPRGR